MFYSCVLSPVPVGLREYAGVQPLRVDRKRGDCSKAPRNLQKSTYVCLRLPVAARNAETQEHNVDLWPAYTDLSILSEVP